MFEIGKVKIFNQHKCITPTGGHHPFHVIQKEQAFLSALIALIYICFQNAWAIFVDTGK